MHAHEVVLKLYYVHRYLHYHLIWTPWECMVKGMLHTFDKAIIAKDQQREALQL